MSAVLLWDRAKRQKVEVSSDETVLAEFLRSNPHCDVVPVEERRDTAATQGKTGMTDKRVCFDFEVDSSNSGDDQAAG